uniref:Chemokine interleukin-8-like domain-containing protein n=1 Tax=Anas platyrhynchos platyrhynchos TaxID=8840 RepID=A0A493SYH8_ANAPP
MIVSANTAKVMPRPLGMVSPVSGWQHNEASRCPLASAHPRDAGGNPVHGGNNVLDCCLRTSENPIPRRIVQRYQIQLVQDGCEIPANVFITVRGKRLCAPLEAPWAVRLREKLDSGSARKVPNKGN